MTENLLIVSCEGEPKEDGHPKVFLTLEERQDTICPYCGKNFGRKSQQERSFHDAS